jgi:polyisoprenoid-binding protein YceI
MIKILIFNYSNLKKSLKKTFMKKLHILILTGLLLSATFVNAQKYMTKTGSIRFYSHTPMEDIEATNKQVNSALDITSGEFIFKLLMKGFEFEKALMQEHFNENYVESDKYPNASFKGKALNLKDLNFSKDGTYPATIEGDLTIHGVTKKITEKGTFEVKGGKIIGKSKFNISLKDYNVIIPKAVVNNISDIIEITVDVSLEKLK